jgi:hypothetical protein
MFAAAFFRQRLNFSVDLAEIICQMLVTLEKAFQKSNTPGDTKVENL